MTGWFGGTTILGCVKCCRWATNTKSWIFHRFSWCYSWVMTMMTSRRVPPPDQMVDDCPYWSKIERVMGKRRLSGWCWLEPWNGLWLSKCIGNGKSSQLDELIFFRGTETINQTTWVGFNVCFFAYVFNGCHKYEAVGRTQKNSGSGRTNTRCSIAGI